MALVALYRSAPLRQRISKGYSVYVPGHGRGAEELVGSLLAGPPPLPAGPSGQPHTVRGSARARGALWVDTGRVSLHDPATRARTAEALAVSVARVAADVRRRGGLLLPTGWQQQPDPLAGLCADLHSAEVLNPVQREVFTNLVREHTASLIALGGRQLYGPGGVAPGGSARLSRSFDQVSTRYLDSCAPEHLERVRTRLRQEERVGRLEVMDVSPLGMPEAHAGEDVTVRLFDAQVTVAGTLAHALLVQALSMWSRDLERTGRRVRQVPQFLLEQNRARAVAHGLAAELRVDQTRRTEEPPRTQSAGRAVRTLLSELLPYLRQLDATTDELAPLFLGVEMAGSAAASGFVRNENDLLAHWHREDRTALAPERLAQGLATPDWLTADHCGASNRTVGHGSWAAARVWLTDRLAGPAPQPDRRHEAQPDRRHEAQPDRRHEAQRDRRPEARREPGRPAPLTADQLLDRLARPDLPAPEVMDALRSYCRAGGTLDLTRPLRSRGRDEARALRRVLRPRAGQRVRCEKPPVSWDDATATRALRAAGEQGVALMHWDLPAQDRARVREALRGMGRAPGGVRTVLLTDTNYTAREGEKRGTVEVLLVAPREGTDR
ncbi:hypothetical protein AB0L28_04650 [Streptomyces sp. NPDC052503]|uniref:hypothetical protein n=1 Tax=unclassified Streptomyces TaxID=2593676 RepID=UPI0029A5B12A|nr:MULTISPECIES: hypothetical protein [unclassified Streptomyces]MDX3180476.1 hypothetical protein [Streptomyces sp. ME02-7008A-1]MDX3301217.1 hypothetical protein [Streptomyces sp. ME02-7008A]